MEIVKSDGENSQEQSEAQALMFETLLETLMPKIKPAIGPATKKFTEFMSDGNMLIARYIKGKVFFFHIKESDVEQFELKPGSKPVNSYDVGGLVENILTGNFKI